MKLEELIRETDALTYLNALKVTLSEIKKEVAQQDELRDYQNQSAERVRKLMRKADNQYRLVAKIVTKEAPFATEITIEDETQFDQTKEVMEGG